MILQRKRSIAIGILTSFGLLGAAQAEPFKVVRVVPQGAYEGKRAATASWSAFPYGPQKAVSPSAAKIGDPVLLTLDKRVAAADARRKAAAAEAAAKAAESAAAQAAPAEPAGTRPAADDQTAEEGAPLIVRYPRPGYRAEAPWTYHPRGGNYAGTPAPRYYHTQPPRYLEAQPAGSYEPGPARPWGYQAAVEAYSYDLRQLRGLAELVEGQMEVLGRTARQ